MLVLRAAGDNNNKKEINNNKNERFKKYGAIDVPVVLEEWVMIVFSLHWTTFLPSENSESD